MRSVPQAAYMIWILISTVGVLQALASYYNWAGLSFFRGHPRLGYLCGAILVPASYWWFFVVDNRNTPGLEGWQLFSRFAVAVAAGLVVVLIVSSLLNRDMPRHAGRFGHAVTAGLDGLHDQPYARLLLAALRRAVTPGEQ